MKATLLLLAALAWLAAACVAPADDAEAQHTAAITKEWRLTEVLDELQRVQQPQPTEAEIDADPTCEVTFSSPEDLAKQGEVAGCEADVEDSPRCDAIAAAEQYVAQQQSDGGCSSTYYCEWPNWQRLTTTCRRCMTCCDVRDESTECVTKCTGNFSVSLNL